MNVKRALSHRAAPWAILLLVWLAFSWRYFLPPPLGVTFPDGDFTQQFFIFRSIAYNAIAGGHLPLWADCFFAGYPFHADPQSQLFYPPVWISFAFLRLMGWGHYPLLALTLEALTHYWVASALMFIFLRQELAIRGNGLRGNAPPLIGALVFAYGGYLTGYAPLQTGILETATWLPLTLLAMRGLAARGRAREIAWSAFALSLAFFAGHPQTFLFLFYVSAAYYFFRVAGEKRPLIAATLRLAGVGVGLLAIVSVQLLPQLQFLANSTRASLGFEQLAAGFPFGIVAQFFITDNVWSPLYVGILPLALAALLWRRNQSGAVWFWWAVAAVALILSFGGLTPLYSLAYRLLPAYNLFRGQERIAFLVSFALATLCAFGAKAFLSPMRKQHRWRVTLVFIVIFALGLCVAILTIDLSEPSSRTKLWLFVLGSALSINAIAVRWRRAALAAENVIAMVALGLLLSITPTNAVPHFDPYPYYAFLDPIRAESAPYFRVQDDARMQGHFACAYGLKEWGGISPIRLASWSEFDNRAPEALRWKLIGAKYLVTWKNGAITRENELPPAELAAAGFAPQGEAKVYRLYEIPRRAWIATDVRIANSDDEVFAILGAPGFDAYNSVVLRQPVSGIGGAKDSGGNVTLISDRAGHVVLNVSSPAGGLLVLNEAYYPGWTAIVNGEHTEVVQANGYFMGVRVPAGEYGVTIRYQPGLLALGSIATVLALVALVGALVISSRKPVI